MPNPLQSMSAAPPPDIAPANPLQQGGPPPGGSPLQGQPQQPPPTLTHQEAVAALRHFHAIQDELEGLLKNPGLGKSDIKSAIIDGTTKLVAGRILTPAAAVVQLATVPEKPRDQQAWIEQHYQHAMAAQAGVIEYHRAAGPGSQDWATEGQIPMGDPDKHIETMSSVMDRFKGSKRG